MRERHSQNLIVFVLIRRGYNSLQCYMGVELFSLQKKAKTARGQRTETDIKM